MPCPLLFMAPKANGVSPALAETPPSKRYISALTMVKGGGVMPAEYYVAWWNLENLFDEESVPALFSRQGRR